MVIFSTGGAQIRNQNWLEKISRFLGKHKGKWLGPDFSNSGNPKFENWEKHLKKREKFWAENFYLGQVGAMVFHRNFWELCKNP